MMLALAASLVPAYHLSPVAPVRAGAMRAPATPSMSEDLQALAKECNPVIGFFDPLGLAKQEFWSESNEATVAFLRHAEIKHGRVAMAGFVGYIVHANDIRFPWAPVGGEPIPTGLSPPDLWDAIPLAAKAQIFGLIGLLEIWSECAGEKHYMRGGRPGEFPSFKNDELEIAPHPMPFDLFDPFGFSKKATPEQKAKGLVKEINNGRLAQLGLFAFLCEAKIPGSVPGLSGIVAPYAGEPMAPLAADFSLKTLGL